MTLISDEIGEKDIYSENFEFYSHGEKQYLMGVNYSYIGIEATTGKQVYNLGFGVLRINSETGLEEIDDSVKTNNGDRDKILATVAFTALSFFDKHPDTIIYFEGSSPSRIRTYQMALNHHFETLKKDFLIRGYTEEDYLPEEFEKDKKYVAFLIEKK
jgi:hypothetical protein